jgi:hypothetical protein
MPSERRAAMSLSSQVAHRWEDRFEAVETWTPARRAMSAVVGALALAGMPIYESAG